jgi:hypothetical protein
MGTFNGKVKKVKTKKTNHDEYETIVNIVNDTSNEVDQVKVTYPSWTGPNTDPVICLYSSIQNGERIFKDSSLNFSADVDGKSATLEIVLEDSNGNVLKTENYIVVIEGANT